MITILTNVGISLVNSGFLTGIAPKITTIKFGDGNGSAVVADPTMTDITNVVYTTGVSSSSISNNIVTLLAEIPVSVGGFTIREVGIYDENGVMIAVGGEINEYKSTIEENAEELKLNIQFTLTESQTVSVNFNATGDYASTEALNTTNQSLQTNIENLNNLSSDVYHKDSVNDIFSRLKDNCFYLPLKKNLEIVDGTGTVYYTREDEATLLYNEQEIEMYDVDEPRFVHNEGLLIEAGTSNKASTTDNMYGWTGVNVQFTRNVSGVLSPLGVEDVAVSTTTGTSDPYVAKTISLGTALAGKYVAYSIWLWIPEDSPSSTFVVQLYAYQLVSGTGGTAINKNVTVTTTPTRYYLVRKMWDEDTTTNITLRIDVGSGTTDQKVYMWRPQAEVDKQQPSTPINLLGTSDWWRSNETLNIYAGDDIPNLNRGFTISCKFTMRGFSTSTVSQFFSILDDTENTVCTYWRYIHDTKKVSFTMGTQGVATVEDVELNTPTKLTVTYDGIDTMKLYKDGILTDERTDMSDVVATAYSYVKMSGWGNLANVGASGDFIIADVLVKDFPLTDTEIALL